MNDKAVHEIIRTRVLARKERERQQGELIAENDLHAATIHAKLDGLCETNQFYNFGRCGKEKIFRTCHNCRSIVEFSYRCNLKWCPRCAWRQADKRKDLLRLWTSKIKQPKHLILTQRNFKTLTRTRIKEHTGCLASLRRRKIFSSVQGGCVSTEITNEGKGWHLHSHWLLDVRFLPIQRVAQVWASMVGQDFAVCRIYDVRQSEYIQEVCKYVVEGSELASWPADEINQFVQAVRGRRFFQSFGSLRKLAPQIRAEIEAAKPAAKVCDCGCSDFGYETETQAVVSELRSMERSGRLRPSKRTSKAELLRGPEAMTLGAQQAEISF